MTHELVLAMLYTAVTTVGAIMILSIMHARRCRPGERAFWIAASVAVFVSGVAIWVPFWGRIAEIVSVGFFTATMWPAFGSREVRNTNRTEQDVKDVEDRLAAVLGEEDAAIRVRLESEHAQP